MSTAAETTAPSPSTAPSNILHGCEYPIIGVAAVILGAIISTLNTRISAFGLADIRGGLSLGFDEGSWITTVFGAAQMLVTPAAAWMSTVLGTRRVLLFTGAVFTVGSLLFPFTTDYSSMMTVQLVRGLAVGTFIPAALGFVLRSLQPRWWIWGIAAYAFRFTFSQNIAGALEGWYSESGQWQWILWQNVVLTPLMMAMVFIAMPRRPVDRQLFARTDWPGIIYAGLGFGMIYAAIDQGNRLDWLNSGLINGLLLGGLLLVVAYFVHEARAEFPLTRLWVLRQRNVYIPAVLISLFGFGSTATAYVLPDYLTRIQGLRDLQIGDTLNWIALPQFVLVPLVALVLRWIDARLILLIGFATISIGCWMNTGLTHDWAGGDFLPSQCIEAVGLAFAITAVVTYTVSHVTPPQAAGIATTIQVARLLGAEIGTGGIQTFIRVREQTYSNLIGLHVQVGATNTVGAATQFAGKFNDVATGADKPATQGLALLASMVEREAYVLAYIDAFWLIAWASVFGVALILFLRPPPPNPMTPPRIIPPH
jgi:MFS transporter, DHA2 family, multidrug resistance protein